MTEQADIVPLIACIMATPHPPTGIVIYKYIANILQADIVPLIACIMATPHPPTGSYL